MSERVTVLEELWESLRQMILDRQGQRTRLEYEIGHVLEYEIGYVREWMRRVEKELREAREDEEEARKENEVSLPDCPGPRQLRRDA